LKLRINDEVFYNPAFDGAFVGQKISIGGPAEKGNIITLNEIPIGTQIYNIERNPGDGGRMMRVAGTSALLNKKPNEKKVILLMPNKKEVTLNGDCRATIGIIAGDGRTLKPFVTAGKKYYKMKARSKLWPRISAVAVNAIDHPFGSGRGKRIKSKIAKRNAPPGRNVGHLHPSKTGHKR